MAYVNASEISEFSFCERAWWLKKHNYYGKLSAGELAMASKRLRAGTEYHRDYSDSVGLTATARSIVRKLILAAAVLGLIVFGVLIFFSQAHAFSVPGRPRPPAHSAKTARTSTPAKPSQIAPVQMLLQAMAGILILALLLKAFTRRQGRKWQIPRGKVISIGDAKTKVLNCSVMKLAGKPDAVFRDGRYFVPEERKSRALRPGESPLPGHILQLVAYCYLVNKHLGPVQKRLLSYH